MEHLPPPLLVSGNSPDALAAAADRLREEVGPFRRRRCGTSVTAA